MTDLSCCICMFTEPTDPDEECPEAVTVLDGYAVCNDHAPLVAQGGKWVAVLHMAREDKP